MSSKKPKEKVTTEEVGFTSFLTLTPAVFSHIEKIGAAGEVTNPVRGQGIFLFGAVVVFLIISGIILLLKKLIKASGNEKTQLKFIFVGSGHMEEELRKIKQVVSAEVTAVSRAMG